MFVLQDPSLWAFVGMFGLLAGTAVVGGTRLGRSALLGFAIVMICDLARIILVLRFCIQLRFDIGVWNWIVGSIILAVALVLAAPALSIKWWAAPEETVTLRTHGIYGIVRNPVYLADISLSLGFAIMSRSIIGVALVAFWWGWLSVHRTDGGRKPGTGIGPALLGIQETSDRAHHPRAADLTLCLNSSWTDI